MWYVGPDGTVYEHLPGSESCSESPDFVDLRDCSESPTNILDQSNKLSDRIMKMRESEARVKRDEAMADYLKAKAQSEKRKNNPWQ